jgi:pyrroline-5-carboxylate reductase
MNFKKIAIIGAGNLGQAFTEGLLDMGIVPNNIHITRRKLIHLENLKNRGVVIGTNNKEACKGADLIVLAIKPWQVNEVLEDIKPSLTANTALVSFVSGVSLNQIVSKVEAAEVYRVMPNTAIEVKESMTLISTNSIGNHQIDIEHLFSSLGDVMFISDELMDSATVIGACGIAYALRFVRALTQGGVQIGFKSDEALEIATQTLKGAMQLIQTNGTHPEEEIDKVTTPKGCTIAGLNEMEQNGFSASTVRGILTSYNKLKED